MPWLQNFVVSPEEVSAYFMMQNSSDSTLSVLYWNLYVNSNFRRVIVISYTGRRNNFITEVDLSDI